jgi:hypothetical protein
VKKIKAMVHFMPTRTASGAPRYEHPGFVRSSRMPAAVAPPCESHRHGGSPKLVHVLPPQAQLQAAVLSDSTPPPPPPADGGDDGLSGGQIAGIVIGCVAGVALFAVLA